MVKEPKKLKLKVFGLSLKAHAESFVSERVISSSRSSTSANFSVVVNINAQSKGPATGAWSILHVIELPIFWHYQLGWERGRYPSFSKVFKQNHHDIVERKLYKTRAGKLWISKKFSILLFRQDKVSKNE